MGVPFDRNPKGLIRTRRALQQLATFGQADGVTIGINTGGLYTAILNTTGGLQATGGIGILLDANKGLALSAAGLAAAVAAPIKFTAGAIALDLEPLGGLALFSNQLGVKVDGTTITINGSGALVAAAGGSGVTSVALALPSSVFNVTGSPVTATGTLTGAFVTQAANSIFAGPTTGLSAAPTFRALVAADIPALSYVTSVGLSLPAAVFTVTGTPVTAAGTLAATFATQAANQVFAGPTTGAAAAPTFRALVAADIAALPAAVFANPTGAVGTAAVNGSATTAMRSDAAPAIDQTMSPTMTNTWVFSKSGAASVSAINITGDLFQAGSTTTTKPLVLIEKVGTASAGWNTAGTFFGINMPSGLGTPFFLDFQLAGVSKCMIRSDGQITGSGLVCSGVVTGTVFEAPANNTTMSVQNRTFTAASGTSIPVDLIPAYTQTVSAGSIDFRINRTENSLGSGTHSFVDFQVATVSKYKISNKGEATAVHRIGGGAAPAIAAGTGAGTTPTIGIAGTDTAGTVTLTTGTTPATGATVFTVTFNTAFAAAPYVTFAPANRNAANLSGATSVFVTATTTTFLFTSGTTALTATTQYIWNYHAIG